MKEDLLHYVWKFQKLTRTQLKCVHGEQVQIHHPGTHNLNAGPDFFNAKLSIDGQLWAGNVEIHLKSSDWYAHNHQNDDAYTNVVLHVVWQHDAEVYRNDGTVIPTFVVSNYVDSDLLDRYKKLMTSRLTWINCENELPEVDEFLIKNWLERLYFERLEDREKLISKELSELNNHWEALLFRMLFKNFGLKINAPSFLSIARSFDFKVIQKNTNSQTLEALLIGQAGLLDEEKEDAYFLKLKEEYHYLRHKYNLTNAGVVKPHFFRLRPPNFPTIRLSQLAVLYADQKNVFSDLIKTKEVEVFYDLFDVAATEYWTTHFNFGVPAAKRKKKLTKKFINLLLINTVIPIKFSYAKRNGEDISEQLIELATSLAAEENSILSKFNSIRPMAENSLESQALLQLKNNYCDKNKCLNCAIGNNLVGNKAR